ncbi:FG-GAP-like repeat-containing protein [Streptomyces sp. NPDC101118]|uniref:FG-GAP-like repeat-containing protein n=1 Tax=Streptomyces sp. NPDC101118 TaxID=3366109 RepID=UPI0038209227
MGRSRALGAAALALAMGAGALTAGAWAVPAAAADVPVRELTIPAPPHQTPAEESFYAAGSGVTTWDAASSDLRWQSLGDGRVEHHGACGSTDRMAFLGDEMACDPESGDRDGDGFKIYSFASGKSESVPRPENRKWAPAYSSRRVLAYEQGADGDLTLHLIGRRSEPGADDVVSVPGRITDFLEVLAFDERGALVRHGDGGTEGGVLGLVDFGTAELRSVPHAFGARGSHVEVGLSAGWVVQHAGETTAYAYSRQNLSAPPRAVPVPSSADSVQPVGDWLVVHSRWTDSEAVTAVPMKGGTSRLLLPRSRDERLRAGSDGGAYIVGGTDSEHWGVQRIVPDGTGTPVAGQVLRTPPKPAERGHHLGFAHGQLTIGQRGTPWTLEAYNLSLSDPDTAPKAPSWTCGRESDTLVCAGDNEDGGSPEVSTWNASTGDGRLVGLAPADKGFECMSCVVEAHVRDARAGGAVRVVRLDSMDRLRPSRIESASGRYVLFLATRGAEVVYVVADIDSAKVLKVMSGGVSALWGSTLWEADGDNGVIAGTDLRTGQVVRRVDLGSGCRPYDLKVVGEWFHASCAYGRKAVAYNGRTKARFPLPDATWTRGVQLGDGYVVTVTGDRLVLTNLRSGTAVTEFTSEPMGDFRNFGRDWVIDPYGGRLAYTDQAQTVHVVRPSGAASAVVVTDSAVRGGARLTGGASWQPMWWTSKPTASYTLTLTHKATGKVVRTLTGGQRRGLLSPAWTGKDGDGHNVPNGSYAWSLTARPADGKGVDLKASGTVTVSGSAARRDFLGQDGRGDLLALSSSGTFTFHQGNGRGGFGAKLSGAGWPTTSRPVPFGDLNGDRCNDLLVRDAAGVLRAYLADCGKAVVPTTRSQVIGTGWGQYDVLTSPGDLTGDGRADLVVRKASTGDMYLYAANGTGAFRPAVRIQLNWKLYRSVFGAGDLNGDGVGDLLAVDGNNAVWRYDGVATGTVKPRVRVKDNGWAVGRNAFVGVGDITGDGRPDVVSRNAAGDLLLNKGTSTAGLSATTRITTGFGAYKGLF